MEITEVRIKLVAANNDKLRAFCSITIDHDFVVRDLKVIEGAKGPFVAMPSRKLTQRCSRCGSKNPHRANFCNDCGGRLPERKQTFDPEHRLKLHADIAHPINSRCRESIQRQVLDEYSIELERAKDPHYQPAEIDVFDDDEYLEVDGADARAPQGGDRWRPSRFDEPGTGTLDRGAGTLDRRAETGPSEGAARWPVGRPAGESGASRSRRRTGTRGLPERVVSQGRAFPQPGELSGDRPSVPTSRRPRDDDASNDVRDGVVAGDSRSRVGERTDRDYLVEPSERRDESEPRGYFARDKIPSRRAPLDDGDGEPEDNFGEGLFS